MEVSIQQVLVELKAISNEDKVAYLDVLSKCPELLILEAPLRRYCVLEDVSAEKPARQFVGYWEKRRAVFGDEKFFLPLRPLHGQMSESCISLLRSMWIVPIPRENNSRPLCFLNISSQGTSSENKIPHEDRLKCLFYVLQALCEQVESQTKGCVFLIFFDHIFDEAKCVLAELDDMLQVFPLKVNELHLISTEHETEHPMFFESFVQPALKLMLSSNEKKHSYLLENCHHIHLGKSTECLLTSLENFGIERKHIPEILGGQWNSNNARAWLDSQNTPFLPNECTTARAEALSTMPSKEETTKGTLTPDEKRKNLEKKHSRQKRDRWNCKVSALRAHIDFLENVRRKNIKTYRELRGLLKKARPYLPKEEYDESSESGSEDDNVSMKPKARRYAAGAVASVSSHQAIRAGLDSVQETSSLAQPSAETALNPSGHRLLHASSVQQVDPHYPTTSLPDQVSFIPSQQSAAFSLNQPYINNFMASQNYAAAALNPSPFQSLQTALGSFYSSNRPSPSALSREHPGSLVILSTGSNGSIVLSNLSSHIPVNPLFNNLNLLQTRREPPPSLLGFTGAPPALQSTLPSHYLTAETMAALQAHPVSQNSGLLSLPPISAEYQLPPFSSQYYVYTPPPANSGPPGTFPPSASRDRDH